MPYRLKFRHSTLNAKGALELFSCTCNATLLHCMRMKKALVPHRITFFHVRAIQHCSIITKKSPFVHQVMNEKCLWNKFFDCNNVGDDGAYQVFAPMQHFFFYFCCRSIGATSEHFFAPWSSFCCIAEKTFLWGTKTFFHAHAMEQCCIACA